MGLKFAYAPIVSQVCDSKVFQRGNLWRNTPQPASLQVQDASPLSFSNLQNREEFSNDVIEKTSLAPLQRDWHYLSYDNVAIVHVL